MSLSPAGNTPKVIPTGSKLVVREEVKVVPMSSTLKIKTRVAHKNLEMGEVIPQLWVSQTPKLVRAYHQKGIFQNPVVEDVVVAIKTWEQRKQDELKKLAALIRKIIDLAKQLGGNAVLKYDVEGDKLVITKVDRNDMLPKDLYSKWEDENGSLVPADDVPGTEIAATEPDSKSSTKVEGFALQASTESKSKEKD